MFPGPRRIGGSWHFPRNIFPLFLPFLFLYGIFAEYNFADCIFYVGFAISFYLLRPRFVLRDDTRGENAKLRAKRHEFERDGR